MIQFTVHFILPLAIWGTREIMKEERIDHRVINSLTIILSLIVLVEMIVVGNI